VTLIHRRVFRFEAVEDFVSIFESARANVIDALLDFGIEHCPDCPILDGHLNAALGLRGHDALISIAAKIRRSADIENN
jgi:hypothetical protein